MTNVAEALASEIRRVSALRSTYAALTGIANVNVKPVLFMIDLALDAAVKAAGVDDATVQIAALEALREYTE